MRQFTHRKGFQDKTSYIEIDNYGKAWVVSKEGERKFSKNWTIGRCLDLVEQGHWIEITPTEKAIFEIHHEFMSTSRKHSAFNSVHEGYGIILEELDELWEEVKKKKEERSKEKLRAEAKQVAAMALRFMVDLT